MKWVAKNMPTLVVVVVVLTPMLLGGVLLWDGRSDEMQPPCLDRVPMWAEALEASVRL